MFGKHRKDSRFHLRNSENEANLLPLLRSSGTSFSVAKQQTPNRVFQMETSFSSG